MLLEKTKLPGLPKFFIFSPFYERFYSHQSFDSVTYTKLVQNSTKSGCMLHGKLAHTQIIKSAFKPCLFLLNNLLNMYSKAGEMDVAHRLFDKMSKPNLVSYNSLISGYNQMGAFDKAMQVFVEARKACLKLDKFTYAGAIHVCAQNGDLKLGKLIHGLIVVRGLVEKAYLTNSLIDMYFKCERADQARFLFENSKELDAVSWNTLIAGYVRMNKKEEMLKLLISMHRNGLNLNTYTMGSVLKACCTNTDIGIMYGEMLHGCLMKLGLDVDIFVGTALLDMYAKKGELNNAIKIFKIMPNRNIVMYNAMISGFTDAENISKECANEACGLFFEIQTQGLKPSKFTFSSMLKACNAVEDFVYGKQIHAQVCKYNLQSDEFIGSALIELYSLMRSTEDGLKCFRSTPMQDIVLWTSMIAGYVQNGQFESALYLFYKLLASGGRPDEFVTSNVLSACADLATARLGELVHGHAIKSGLGNFRIVQNSQICMYAKCGDMDSADLTFQETENPDVVSWSVMICSYAQHGCARGALNLFGLMKEFGILPNHITFTGVLSACSYGGLVEEGLQYFESMKDYDVEASVEHYCCVVDLFGRAGRLAEAENFILTSSFKDNPVIWRALLSSCRVYKDTVTGKRAARKVIELEPQEAASYVLLRNIYADAALEPLAASVRELMQQRGVKKKPGLSWI
ncbi:pentatricopeptide repeat-containing protein At3g13880 isoform X1 [Durio zibethinus]|uniref:Pentatricopeptide repeat-containing protein At3g13880 isoform X1 n=1 Tax=Durio zibethinus TaxID=66656 RepID=A0A6P5WS02_DURZI|nr:pentatricopeptide repeat-containing protein At3g13880 isoform X1 [Durio zibethinus]